MATLAEAVGTGAQEAQNQAGHSVGDAMQAYHIAATADHARQELDMQKADQERNKATWVTSQLSAIARMPEQTRKIASGAFVKQAQAIYPEMSGDVADAIQKDSEFTKNLAMTFAKEHGQDPTVISNAFGGDLPSLQQHISKTMEEDSKIKAAQLGMASVRAQQLEETKRQNALHFSEKVTTDKIIGLSRQSLNSLNRSESILNNPNLPVTAKDLNLAYNDFINAVAAGGAATEGKIAREMPETWAQEFNTLQQKMGKNADLRSTPAGKALIDQLGGRITAVKGDINDAISQQAQVYHDMGVKSGNPYVADAAKGVLQQYAPSVYKQKYGGGDAAQAAPSAPASAPPAPASAQQAAPSHLDHLSTAELLKLWTAKQQQKTAGGQ